MYNVTELSVPTPLAEEPAQLPVRVLLTLPDYITSGQRPPLFNVPAAVSRLLGRQGWKVAERVMPPQVWAPGWNPEQLRTFVTTPFLGTPWAFPEVNVENFRSSKFPDGEHEIIHFIGFVSTGRGYPAIHLLDNPFGMQSGALRDALVRAQTRLLILQVPSEQYSNAARLATFVVGGGGPAVLVVQSGRVPDYNAFPRVLRPMIKNWSWEVDDKEALDTYFLGLYANILHNRPLSDLARPEPDLEKRGMTATLIHGQGGNGLLQFDRWVDTIQERIRKAQKATELPKEGFENLRGLTRRLHRSQQHAFESSFRSAESTMERETSSVNTQTHGLLRMLDFHHETGGVIPLSELAGDLPLVEAAAEQLKNVRSQLQEELEKGLNEEAARAPRVLNAGFANTETRSVLGKGEALVAGRAYDFLVDVGPRWDKVTSLVTGNAAFPEEALPPDQEGYAVQVVLISEDFSPSLSSAEIWVPRATGRSFLISSGQRCPRPGPASLRVRAPAFPEGSSETVRDARARLSLYYENNLLQSALVNVGIARSPAAKLEEDNSVEVDYVLTGGFQEVDRFAKRSLKQRLVTRFPESRGGERKIEGQREPPELTPEGEVTEYRVALNLTLNGDGNGQHRILIKGHPESTPVWRPYNPSASAEILKNARQELSNCFCQRDADYNALSGTKGLNDQNGKDYRQFTRDIYKMALLGESLYNAVFSRVQLGGTGKDWDEWQSEFRRTITSTSVIQVARTGPAEYVLPWALLYDYPLPDEDRIDWCDVIKEWGSDGIRTKTPEPCCPHKDEPKHKSNIICPYGFWGLRHFIEQPPSPLYKSDETNKYELPTGVTDEIRINASVKLAVAITRDTDLDQSAIIRHLQTLKEEMAFSPSEEADDWNKVCTMLGAPEIAYFLCHGEIDASRPEPEPYLGVGLRDNNLAHRVYPNKLLSWARSPSFKRWRDRRPLIFINGCHTSDLKPDDILDFVYTFAVMGASGVIGTEISVRLPLAIEIGQSLLRKIAGGAKVGEAMYQARWELANKGNLLGLAYTPYCLNDLRTVKS